MADKYLKNTGGTLTEIEGTTVSVGAGSSGKIVALDGAGKLDLTVMPTGVAPSVVSVATSENLAAGDLVNIWSNGGVPTARKADASNGRQAVGFVIAGSTSPNNATVYLESSITGLTGLTPGSPYFLSGTTAGAITATAPTTAGFLCQMVGWAINTTTLSFEPALPIILA